MRLNQSNTFSTSDCLKIIYGNRPVPKSISLLEAAGIKTIEDLLWILPLKINRVPMVDDFTKATEGEIFKGIGKILSFKSHPMYGRRGRNKALLHNITAIVLDASDNSSNQTIKLQWFNAYGSTLKKIKDLDFILFNGPVTIFNGQKQIVTPEIEEHDLHIQKTAIAKSSDLQIKYPTINGVKTISKIFEKIPRNFWDEIDESLSPDILKNRQLLSLAEAFKTIHGITPTSWSIEKYEQAINRLIYQEFFNEQIKISARKLKYKKKIAPIITSDNQLIRKILDIFPYPLTKDQLNVISEIQSDFTSGHPMMRLIQGDVGCGKTTVALISGLIAIKNGKQVALMCPTESLALQHYWTIKDILESSTYQQRINIALLTGSNSQKEKLELNQQLKNGGIDLIIGTHALFQNSVEFSNLGLAIIDEQHKFGVDQRIKLVSKGAGTHCLIMTATPIPRSLSLTQYGDLDISTIRTIPSGRKGTKTRIITPNNFSQLLNFINTRLDMKEQIYIVAPAITEGENMENVNYQNVENIFERFQQFFPNHTIVPLHGRLSSMEKNDIFTKFTKQQIDILVSTSVIEVGINVTNATVMAIMNPERFGLSSLHQLRGRVGRGEKPGFCFLILDQLKTGEALDRLKMLENTVDGFKIAEADLLIRGQGDLFGTNQSGIGQNKIANIILHNDILIQTIEDIKKLHLNNDSYLINSINRYHREIMVTTTI